jgi:hypothetical protein
MRANNSRYLLSLCLAVCWLGLSAALGQQKPAPEEAIPLTVQPGVPLHVVLEKSVPVKKAGVPVEGRLLEPIYVFDDMVIPSGTQVLGRVTQVENASHKRRMLAIANGNFSPLRKAHIEFDTLVLPGGRRLQLETSVSDGAPRLVHLWAGEGDKKKRRVGEAVAQARQEVKAREQEAMKEITSPGKVQRMKSRLSAELPYHRPSLQAGTQFTAELKKPLSLGREDRSAKDLEQIGTQIPPGSVVHVRLLTALSSAINQKGSSVQAVIAQPVFSPDRHLILPEGTRLVGQVTQAVPARRLGRNGQLRFMFRQIDLPGAAPRIVEASLEGVDASSGAHMKLDSEGGAHAITPKTKYIAPAIDVLLATSSLDGLDPHNHRRIEEGLGPQGPDVAGGIVLGGAGFGLVGSIVGLTAHYRPVSSIFAFYGAGWSVYSHVVARGTDVVFPRNTPMEIRFGTHEDQVPKGKSFISELKGAKAS